MCLSRIISSIITNFAGRSVKNVLMVTQKNRIKYSPYFRVIRVIIRVKTVVSDQQGSGLHDYQAGAMMTYYNSRERARAR